VVRSGFPNDYALAIADSAVETSTSTTPTPTGTTSP
jgi:hypothetical protein